MTNSKIFNVQSKVKRKAGFTEKKPKKRKKRIKRDLI